MFKSQGFLFSKIGNLLLMWKVHFKSMLLGKLYYSNLYIHTTVNIWFLIFYTQHFIQCQSHIHSVFYNPRQPTSWYHFEGRSLFSILALLLWHPREEKLGCRESRLQSHQALLAVQLGQGHPSARHDFPAVKGSRITFTVMHDHYENWNYHTFKHTLWHIEGIQGNLLFLAFLLFF